jgi:hypothetical protein
LLSNESLLRNLRTRVLTIILLRAVILPPQNPVTAHFFALLTDREPEIIPTEPRVIEAEGLLQKTFFVVLNEVKDL